MDMIVAVHIDVGDRSLENESCMPAGTNMHVCRSQSREMHPKRSSHLQVGTSSVCRQSALSTDKSVKIDIPSIGHNCKPCNPIFIVVAIIHRCGTFSCTCIWGSNLADSNLRNRQASTIDGCACPASCDQSVRAISLTGSVVSTSCQINNHTVVPLMLCPINLGPTLGGMLGALVECC